MWTGFYKTLTLRWTQWPTPTEAHVYPTQLIFIKGMQKEIFFYSKAFTSDMLCTIYIFGSLSLISRLFSLVKYLELKLSC